MDNRRSAEDGDIRKARRWGLGLLLASIAVGAGIAYWLVIAGAALAGGAPDPAGRQEPAAVPRARTGLVLTNENRGRVMFGRYCDSCHPAAREGIGPDLRDTKFKQSYTTEAKLAQVVRTGGFDMPAYPPDFLSDDDLAELVRYLLSLPAEGR
jgi:mono/diheme cytochrome c family protein